jgi:hypothetical protein
MKPTLLLLVGLFSAPWASAQPIPDAQLTGPDRTIHDADYGLAFVCPPGWTLGQGVHWGDRQGTIFLQASTAPKVVLSVTYSVFTEPLEPKDGFEAWLRGEAATKAKLQARGDGLADYANRADSFVVRTIGGCTALSWVADYTKGGRKWCELLTQVVAATGQALFSMKVPADQVGDLLAGYDALVTSTRLTTGTALQTMDPRVVEGRKLYRAKEYPKALEAFKAAFQTEPIAATDLVVGAGAAARAGDKELALRWLRLAVTKGFTDTPRVMFSGEFDSLRETEGWKQLVAALPALPVGSDTATDKPLQATLLVILDNDQKYRLQLTDTEKKFGRDSKELKALWDAAKEADAANLAKVTEILDHRGWVGPEAVGPKANSALFLVIQHADHVTQLKYLPMMREAVKNKQALGSQLALLEDRVALGEGRKQIYGSQVGRDNATGKYFVSPLEDPDHVDERRASVGLPPLAQYVNRWDIIWDVEAFKQQQAQHDIQRD